MTEEQADTTWNFGLDRLEGALRVTIVDIANPAVPLAIDEETTGTMSVLFTNKPVDSAVANYTVPTTGTNPQNFNSGVTTGEYVTALNFQKASDWSDVTDAHPDICNRDVIVDANSTPADPAEIILCVSGEENVHITKYVYSDDPQNPGWKPSITADPGDEVYYLAMVWNSGSAATDVSMDDIIPMYQLLASRNVALREDLIPLSPFLDSWMQRSRITALSRPALSVVKWKAILALISTMSSIARPCSPAILMARIT